MRQTELEESDSLNSDYTTKLQWPEQYAIGTKPETHINGAGKSPEVYTSWSVNQQKRWIYNREKTVFLINGVGKTGQLLVKEWN